MIKKIARKIKKELLQHAYLFGEKALTDINIVKNKDNTIYEKNFLDAKIAPIYGNKKGILTIISDDGLLSTGKILDQLSKEYNIPITIAGTVLNVGWHVKWWKKALRENANIELVNHSYNHIRMEEGTEIAKDKKKLIHEIAHSKVYFERRFFNRQISFVCPENQMCSMGYQILKEKGILAVRQGTRGLNSIFPEDGIEPGQYYNLKCMGIMDVTGEHAEETRNEWIKTAISEHKWLIEMWHNVCEDSYDGYQTILTEDAKIHLKSIKDYVKADGLWVARFTDVIKYFIARDHSKVLACYDEKGIYVSLDIKKEAYADGAFDCPLTVCFDVPEKYAKRIKKDDYAFDPSGKLYLEIKPGEKKKILFS